MEPKKLPHLCIQYYTNNNCLYIYIYIYITIEHSLVYMNTIFLTNYYLITFKSLFFLLIASLKTLPSAADPVRLEKFQFMEKRQNRKFNYKIVISVKKIRNLFSRSRMTKRISLLESSREI